MSKEQKQNPNYLHFEVIGGGFIEISKEPSWTCGGRLGFDFGVSWGKYGYAGGVLPKEEAKEMADFILKTLTEDDDNRINNI